uniref:uncharacterized protein C11orf53 homolog n=1 Tax=Monopterus albus TaxID=43700 RepID=UPI0009B4E74D|nr:uncharacterized protein C11orf53 homolog [Monopterus albus]
MDTDYSKRVYQGVRVKHTVKDLLAEKRSRQTNGPRYSTGGSTTPPSFVQMAGSHMVPSYYGMRRPFISDSDFCGSTKQFSPDVYSSTLGGKPLGCEPSTMTSYSSFIDSYYPDTFGDYRSTTAFSSSGGSFLSSSALSSLLPSFSGESSHLFLRDAWEQSVPEPVSQVEALCPDSLAPISVPPSMPSPEPPGSPSQYRASSRGSSSSQPYTLQSLEDAHYHALTTTSSYPPPIPSSSFTCPPYMSSSISDPVSKMVTEEAESHAGLPLSGEAHASWAKEDGVSSWLPYENKKVYQGVRVKITVKELLQRRRAREANSKKVKTDICGSTFPSRYVDPPLPIPEEGASTCDARALQLRTAAFPVPNSSCSIQMQGGTLNQIQQQTGDMMLPSNGYSVNNNNSIGGGSYTASLPPPPTFPLPWCHGLSSDADYYGHEMAPCSSSESLKLLSTMDQSSYSPQDSFSSSSSSCYDSPTRMESSFHGFTSEDFHYQHFNLQDCFSLPYCWSGQQESFSAPEYTPYYNPTDYSYACPVEDNYFKRDLHMSSEMCYNVL